MKLNLLFISLLAIVLTACSLGETKKDKQIDPKIKNQIHELTNQIVDGLVENKPENVLVLCSDNLLKKKGDIKILMQLLTGNLKKHSFKILNEYYQKDASKKNMSTLNSGGPADHAYQIRYESLNKEMYVVVGYFKDSMDQKCFTFIYGKNRSIWKLNNIQAGILKIMNKDAFDWYKLAKTDYDKGYYIDAVCKIGLSTQLLKPANHLWKYEKENEILSFEQKVTKKAYSVYHFPITVDSVSTKPVIFRVYDQNIPGGYFPSILYTTTIDMKDIPKLAVECNQIHKIIGKLFKGITTNNKMLLYRPMKTMPIGTDEGKQYGFIKRN
jgi:hypothetical protein